MEKVVIENTLRNALLIVNNTKDCESIFKDLELDFNKVLIDTAFGFWGHADMKRFNPYRVIVDVRRVSKETLEDAVKAVEEYNTEVWKYHLDQLFDENFVEQSDMCFHAANNYVNEDTPFCPGFNCHKGDTKAMIYDNHKCKILVYDGEKVEEYK